MINFNSFNERYPDLAPGFNAIKVWWDTHPTAVEMPIDTLACCCHDVPAWTLARAVYTVWQAGYLDAGYKIRREGKLLEKRYQEPDAAVVDGATDDEIVPVYVLKRPGLEREQIKSAVRNVLEEWGMERDGAYELSCQVADQLE